MSIDGDTLTRWFPGSRKRARTPSLGERELAVLDVLWQHAPRTAQEVKDQMPGRAVSLSTIQSTLERLHRKDVLLRQKRSRAFYYAPKLQRGELISSLIRDIADDIAGGDVASMVSGFMDFLGEERAQVAPLLGDDNASERMAPSDDMQPSPTGHASEKH
jgi:predicted transcriptional regulator